MFDNRDASAYASPIVGRSLTAQSSSLESPSEAMRREERREDEVVTGTLLLISSKPQRLDRSARSPSV